MLLDPFEEQLDLPARFVKLGDGEGVEGEIVGEEHQPLTGLRIIELDPAQRTVETLARIEAGQENCLIAYQPGRAIDGSRIAAASLEIGLGASDEETSGIIETRKPLEIDIASVHNIEGASFGKKLIQNVDIMHLAIADERGYCRADRAAYGVLRRPWLIGTAPKETPRSRDQLLSNPTHRQCRRGQATADHPHRAAAQCRSDVARSRHRCASRARRWRSPRYCGQSRCENPNGRASMIEREDKPQCHEGSRATSVAQRPNRDTDRGTKTA